MSSCNLLSEKTMRNVVVRTMLLRLLKDESCKTILYCIVGIHRNSTVHTQNQCEHQFSILASYVTLSGLLQECGVSQAVEVASLSL